MRKYYFISIIFLSLTSQIIPQAWFPLEVGNRWDYEVIHIYHGSTSIIDTVLIEIVDKEILSNDLEYFVFSSPYSFWYPPYPTYVREENNEIYFFDEDDSVDCFAFRFDLPMDSTYMDCNGVQRYILMIDSSFTFGIPDIHQNQSIVLDFSFNFGIWHHFRLGGIGETHNFLKGCVISGITYGNLLVSVGEENELPDKFALLQNYPNPFNPSTKIRYEIPERSFVTIKVYDVLGSEVVKPVNEEKSAGSYDVEFDGSGLTSGVYFYRLKAGDYVETKKMVLIK